MKDKKNDEVKKAEEERVNRSRHTVQLADREEEEENYALIPPNGGWGWLVVASAFYCNFVVDGIQLTFGVFLQGISETFKVEYAEVALAGSLMFGVHLLMGPICAALTTVFGLRPVAITGSLVCCFGVAITYFAKCSWYMYFTYGVIGGMGLGLVYMNSIIITTVYFTTLMPIAIGIVVCGTGVGTMVFAALANFLLKVTTWQNSFLMQAALAGSMSIAAISFRPLKPIRVKLTPEAEESLGEEDGAETSKKGAVFLQKNLVPGESEMRGRESILLRGSLASIISLPSIYWGGFSEQAVLEGLERERQTRTKCCNCCRKPRTDSDVIVLSEIKDLYGRRKSYVEKDRIHPVEGPSRVLSDEEPPKKIYTIVDTMKTKNKRCEPFKRTILAMVDCHLLKSCAFILFTISGAIQMASLVIIFIYEKERSLALGFTEEMSVNFVISLGGANCFWRLLLGGIALIPKVQYRTLAVCGIVIGGVATMCSGLSRSLYWQFSFCFLFGLGMASIAVFRPVFMFDLVEFELVGNATGINLLFMGIFCIISPPVFGKAMEMTKNYDVIYISTGFLITVSGLMLIGLKKLRQKELQKLNK